LILLGGFLARLLATKPATFGISYITSLLIATEQPKLAPFGHPTNQTILGEGSSISPPLNISASSIFMGRFGSGKTAALDSEDLQLPFI